MASSKQSGRSSERAQDISETFFGNAHGQRINTDAIILEAIQNKHPGVPVTIVPEFNSSLKAYAGAGLASIQSIETTTDSKAYPNSLKWTIFIPPSRRLDGGSGIIAEETFFESYLYKWHGLEFFVYFVDGRDGVESWPSVRNQFILGDKVAVRTLVETIGRWQSVLHNEIWVFNQGYWQKDPFLYQSILKSDWKDVILDKGLKEDLIDTVERFYDSQDQYHRLRVPWKRGIIFYGPPGNGKTISIKATMHTLYKRSPPIPTLYVKTLVSFMPPEYSIENVFEKARQEAPCYLVFEDLDSLVTDDVRSFFLNAIDGLAENDGILMVGSTNHLERLDPGISKRPSRFDRKYLFPNPDLGQRVKYCHYWQGKLKDNKDIEFPDEICDAAAKITDGFSFAYIQEAFVTALLDIARSSEGGSGLDVDGVEELRQNWEVLDIEDSAPVGSTEKDHKDLDDYILWRKLKYEVEQLRKQLDEGKGEDLV
jgi:transitional endoplasmic reticulum ATPase